MKYSSLFSHIFTYENCDRTEELRRCVSEQAQMTWCDTMNHYIHIGCLPILNKDDMITVSHCIAYWKAHKI